MCRVSYGEKPWEIPPPPKIKKKKNFGKKKEYHCSPYLKIVYETLHLSLLY